MMCLKIKCCLVVAQEVKTKELSFVKGIEMTRWRLLRKQKNIINCDCLPTFLTLKEIKIIPSLS